MRVGCVQEVRQVGTESAGLSVSGAAFDGVDEGLSRNRTGGAAVGSDAAAARYWAEACAGVLMGRAAARSCVAE
jgi:hypothetical protein